MTDFERSVQERFEALRGDALGPLRAAAFERWRALGLPTTRDEQWKYTSLTPLAEARLGPSRARVEIRGGGAWVGRLRDAPELIADGASDAFAALNTALFDDGILIRLPEDAAPGEPIELRFFASSGIAAPRVVILAGPRSRATVIETYAGEGVYLTDALTQISLGEGARLDHYKLQEESGAAFHLALTEIDQGPQSSFTSHSVALGSALARNEVRAIFTSEGSECTLQGLYLGAGRQHLDNRTLIDHQSPRCTSREIYKGILDDRAHGVFNGRVFVRKDAHKSDASQLNKNLILSEGALVDTKPQLEIFNDDVKCSHGAAVGQLDENALFYLRSRGLPLGQARQLLTRAFASETVDLIRLEPFRARVRERVNAKLEASHREAA